MIGKMIVQKVKMSHVTTKVTSQSLVVLSVRHHCAGYLTQKSPKRSRDRDYEALKPDRNVVHSSLRYICRETL